MPQHDTTQLPVPITSNLVGAKNISSLALWNQQYREVDKLVNRLMRFDGVKSMGMTLIGESGAGKSHYVKKKRETLSSYSIDYGDYKTVPVLIVTAPKQSTAKQIIQSMLYELGDFSLNGTVNELKPRLIWLLKKLEVKLIVIDEIHDFLPKTERGKPKEALAWIKGFMDDTCSPFLFVGTERARLLHELDRELASRIIYSASLSSLSYGNEEFRKFDFAEMATAYGEHLPCKTKKLQFVRFENEEPVFSNLPLLDSLFVATKGLPRALRDVFLEINVEMEDDKTFNPDKSSLSEICFRLQSLNKNIDFNPFTNRKAVQRFIENYRGGITNDAA